MGQFLVHTSHYFRSLLSINVNQFYPMLWFVFLENIEIKGLLPGKWSLAIVIWVTRSMPSAGNVRLQFIFQLPLWPCKLFHTFPPLLWCDTPEKVLAKTEYMTAPCPWTCQSMSQIKLFSLYGVRCLWHFIIVTKS